MKNKFIKSLMNPLSILANLAKIGIGVISFVFAALLGGAAFFFGVAAVFLGGTVKICGQRHPIFKIGNKTNETIENDDWSNYFRMKNDLLCYIFRIKNDFLCYILKLYSCRYLKKIDVKSDELERLSEYSKFVVSIVNYNENKNFEVLKEYFNKKGIEIIDLKSIESHVISLLSKDPNFCLIEGLQIQLEIENDENNPEGLTTVTFPAPLELADKIRPGDIF
ncbi:MAG: hypothetical protein CfP315_0241 [Candidatus Improbicoccus pseudotrichonymphae]|uniref:Uncharacterized protein n=1 Tax=Candidatus Improbicoccus pseudotrichonymphae TaxID=3033792 RepID=A0AA48L0R4_9FIRM|nr:MAG: hypothetical protein CfP315_0241 [Candidatus Improbicoccus pseudotrichonymphae]